MAITMAAPRMGQHYFGNWPGSYLVVVVVVSDIDGVGDVLHANVERLSGP